MLKRIRFASGHDALATGTDAPPAIRPARIAVCTTLPDVLPHPRHDRIGLEWFADAEHLARFEAWLAADGRPSGADVVVVAEEHVLRGEDWLERRWRDGGAALKHVALARRASGLGQAEFLDRWRRHAGSVGSVPIPDEARGRAYVQNHPLVRPADWAYDAINEVYVDDAASLRARIAFLDAALAADQDDFVGERSFLAVREELVVP